jgi:hypothetical protein
MYKVRITSALPFMATNSLMISGAFFHIIWQVNRRAMVTATDEFGLTLGARVWRSLVRRLQEMDSLFGIIASQIRAPQRVFWKLDLMENSLRMRKRLKRNYKGTDHHGAALDYQESEQSPTATISSGDTPLPAGAPKLEPEEDAFEEPGEYELRDQEDREEERSENSMKGFGFNTQVFPQTSVAAALAAEPKDKVILEIPAAMVQPLRVVRGRFQVLHLSHSKLHSMNYCVPEIGFGAFC